MPLMSDIHELKAEIFDWVENPVLPGEGMDPGDLDIARASIVADRASLIRTAIGCALLEHDSKLEAGVDEHTKKITEHQSAVDALEVERDVARRALYVIEGQMPAAYLHNEKLKSVQEMVSRRITLFDYIRDNKPDQLSFAGKMKIEEQPFTLWLDPGVDAGEGISLKGWVKDHGEIIRDLFDKRAVLLTKIASELSFRSSPAAATHKNGAKAISAEAWIKKGVVARVVSEGDRQGLRVESLAEFTHEIPGLESHGLASVVALLAIADLQAAERAGMLTK